MLPCTIIPLPRKLACFPNGLCEKNLKAPLPPLRRLHLLLGFVKLMGKSTCEIEFMLNELSISPYFGFALAFTR
jgi:hypothetical protein